MPARGPWRPWLRVVPAGAAPLARAAHVQHLGAVQAERRVVAAREAFARRVARRRRRRDGDGVKGEQERRRGWHSDELDLSAKKLVGDQVLSINFGSREIECVNCLVITPVSVAP